MRVRMSSLFPMLQKDYGIYQGYIKTKNCIIAAYKVLEGGCLMSIL